MKVLVALLLCGVVALLATRLFFIIHAIFIRPFVGIKCKKNKAYKTAEGHVISHKISADENNEYRYILGFEVKGRKYKIRVQTPDCNFSDGTVYYRKNPRGAVLSVDDLGKFEYSLELSIGLYALFFILVMTLGH